MSVDRDAFEDCLFKIKQASDLVIEVAQPLHDSQNHSITRLSFLTDVIDEAVERLRTLVMPDGSPR